MGATRPDGTGSRREIRAAGSQVLTPMAKVPEINCQMRNKFSSQAHSIVNFVALPGELSRAAGQRPANCSLEYFLF